MELLAALEDAPFSVALRESSLMYPAVLALHSIGMAIAVGLSAMIALAILGATPQVPLPALRRFYLILWLGFGLNVITGAALLAMSATKHLSDPVMYVKLACIVSAVVIVRILQTRLAGRDSTPRARPERGGRDRILAAASLALWLVAITAGRLTAYTFFRFWT